MATAIGTVQTLIVCQPASAGVQGACPVGTAQAVVQGYVITASEAARFEAAAEPFDPAAAGAYFGLAFAATLFVYLVSLGAGAVIRMVRTA
ncbi:hypothetical protein HNQ51_000108 [Inhella inkyongensis]|uniref:Uncharacterized protein n=1 Tax=Inhella inkyongensis TaxID=392593 RepID=A0A840RY00_9BURK|nr:hypothetical protein [Inhella inkyongensis]MBB5202815.1 hypothetical protein [Inhella inkyongensis]